jgi:hypothetical protein
MDDTKLILKTDMWVNWIHLARVRVYWTRPEWFRKCVIFCRQLLETGSHIVEYVRRWLDPLPHVETDVAVSGWGRLQKTKKTKTKTKTNCLYTYIYTHRKREILYHYTSICTQLNTASVINVCPTTTKPFLANLRHENHFSRHVHPSMRAGKKSFKR